MCIYIPEFVPKIQSSQHKHATYSLLEPPTATKTLQTRVDRVFTENATSFQKPKIYCNMHIFSREVQFRQSESLTST